jgi:hypothetical protein
MIAMLAMKGWLETRWRLIGPVFFSILIIAINYQDRLDLRTGRNVLVMVWMVLSTFVIMLAGSGVNAQAPTHISFPEGLAESTQFTISLPVSRMLLLAVRAGIGLLETFAITVLVGTAVWNFFPSISESMAPADFARLVLSTLLWLPLPYCAALLSQAFLAEPWSMFPVGYGLVLVLWLCHKVSPALDVIRAFGQASPLLTHRLPLSQLAMGDFLAMGLFLIAAWAVRRHEY